jgi:hypothetical protein
MWVSIAPSLTAISPPHPEADEEARVEQAKDAQDADQVGGYVSDTHVGFSLFASLHGHPKRCESLCKQIFALDAYFFTP